MQTPTPTAARQHQTRSRRLRTVLPSAFVALVVATVTAATIVANPPAAHAAAGAVTCTGGLYIVTANPGLNNTTRSSTLSGLGVLAGCLSLTNPEVNGNAVFALSGSGTGSCLTGGTATFTGTFTWANGETSTGTGTASLIVAFGIPILTVTGGVTSGKFAGGIALGIPGGAFNPAACATPEGMTIVIGGMIFYTLVGV